MKHVETDDIKGDKFFLFNFINLKKTKLNYFI